MRPIRLVMTAFGAYGGSVTLDFSELKDRNFFLITGPTGAGKTTILDAMCFALYGDTSGDRNARSVRSDHAAPEVLTAVEFTFSIGEKQYKIVRMPEQSREKKRGEGRTMQPAEARLWQLDGGEEKLLTANAGQATKKSEELLGFKSAQFRQVVLLPQGEFKKLLTADSIEREKIMQTLFQTEQYAAMERYLKEAARRVQEQHADREKERAFLLQEENAADTGALAALQEGKLQEEKELHQKAKQAEKARDDGRARLEKGRGDALLLQERTEARQKLTELQKKRATVDEHRKKLEQAERALKLADLYKHLQENAAAARQAEEDNRSAAAAAEKAAQETKLAAADFEREKARENERRQLVLESNQFQEWLAKEALFEKTRASCRQKERQLADEQELLTKQKEMLAALRLEVEDVQRELIQLAETAARTEALRLECDHFAAAQKKLAESGALQKEFAALSEKLAQEERKMRQLENEYETKRQLAGKLQQLFIAGQAAFLANRLTDGEACPVCGSTAHPQLAQLKENIPTEEDVKAAAAQMERAAAQAGKKQRDAAALREVCRAKEAALKRLESELDTSDEKELAVKIQQIKRELAQAEQAQQKKQAAEDALREKQRRIKDAEDEQTAREEALKKIEAQYRQQSAELAANLARIPENLRDAAKLKRAAKEKQQELAQAEALWDKAQQRYKKANETLAAAGERHRQAHRLCESATQKYNATKDAWRERLAQAGFGGEEAFLAQRREESYIKNLRARIETFDKNLQSAGDRCARAEKNAASALAVDLSKLEKELARTEEAYKTALERAGEMAASNKKRTKNLARLRHLDAEIASIDKKYRVIGHLADVAGGKNALGVTFQRYVLGNLLDEVADAASLRLKRMSRGRYQLQRTAEKRRKNAQSGLELEVFDEYTGTARSVNTLSGGESFLASLALSLGLAAVVQNYAGGIRLDTILIDEGFGSLDPEALDMALKTLLDLKSGGRLVGIISHVPELKERIDARLEVSASKNGSTAHFSMR